jgi:serine protease inhibitor
MDRREFVLGIGLLALLAGCSSRGAQGPSSSSLRGGAREARSLKARQAGGATDAAVTAVNGLGADLYRRLAAAEPSATLVLSPASIAIALAMAREGAAGITATEMDHALHISKPAALAPSINALDQALAARSGPRPDPAGTGSVDVVLKIANSLWAQRDTPWEQPFLDRLAELHGAGLRLADFKTDAEGARHEINVWVSDETERRIRELLPQGILDDLTRLVLVNAIYLKAPWLSPFEKSLTADRPFSRADGSPVTVPMMRSNDQLAYATGDGWQAVDLPYAGYELTMTVLVADAGRLAEVEAQVSEDLLDRIVGSQALREVNLGLPRWATESVIPLAAVLKTLGMQTAFDPDRADFSAMTDAERLYISAVQHQANITVDEAGTEAAAATAVVIRDTAAALEPIELVVDRPFLFMIRDVPTGTLVFLGRIADPSQHG